MYLSIQESNLVGSKEASPTPHLAKGLNVYRGECTYEGVAKAHGLSYTPWFEAMKVAPS